MGLPKPLLLDIKVSRSLIKMKVLKDWKGCRAKIDFFCLVVPFIMSSLRTRKGGSFKQQLHAVESSSWKSMHCKHYCGETSEMLTSESTATDAKTVPFETQVVMAQLCEVKSI